MNNDIVYISSIKWNYSWHRQQEMMSKFAEKGCRVLFVEPCNKKLHSNKLKHLNKNTWVLTPAGLPYERCLFSVNYINGVISRNLINKVILDLEFYRPIIWLDRVHGFDYNFYNKKYKTVYDLVDETLAFGRFKNKKMLIALENQVLKNADLLISSSQILLERKIKQSNRVGKSIFIPNGVDTDRFHCNGKFFSNINYPKIGYVGTISKRSIDFKLINTIANNHPDWNLIFVGPGSSEDKKLFNSSNIWIFDSVAGDLIPSVINSFDIAIIPYNAKGENMDYVFPRKALEYLSAGKPVISTDMKELKILLPYIDIAVDGKDFENKIVEKLKSKSNSDLLKKVSLRYDWDFLLDQIIICL